MTKTQAPSEGQGPATAGGRIARGAVRLLAGLGFVAVEEMVLRPGLRADIMALGPKGEIWIVECKSGLADFRADRKWTSYLEWADRYLWAVDPGFPVEILPEAHGVILADAWDGHLMRLGEATPLAGARRRAVTQDFARAAGGRLMALRDPRP